MKLTKKQIAELCKLQKGRIEELRKGIAAEAAFANKARKTYMQSLLASMTATHNKYMAMA
jgi:hypothetical protein